MDLTSVQRDILTALVNIYRKENRPAKGEEIAKLIGRSPLLGGSMRLLICVMLFIYVIAIASSVEQLDRPEGKVVILGSIAPKNITNQTIIINLTNFTNQMQMNITNQTRMNLSGLQRSIFQIDVNESRMETPLQADSQPALSRYEWSSLGK